jgi:hypothetical protein
MQEPYIYSCDIFKHVARRDECVTVLEDYRQLVAVEKGRNSSVGIATHYGLDGPGIESLWG